DLFSNITAGDAIARGDGRKTHYPRDACERSRAWCGPLLVRTALVARPGRIRRCPAAVGAALRLAALDLFAVDVTQQPVDGPAQEDIGQHGEISCGQQRPERFEGAPFDQLIEHVEHDGEHENAPDSFPAISDQITTLLA